MLIVLLLDIAVDIFQLYCYSSHGDCSHILNLLGIFIRIVSTILHNNLDRLGNSLRDIIFFFISRLFYMNDISVL